MTEMNFNERKRMEYKLSNNYEVHVNKIANGFVVMTSHPDKTGLPQTFFANELDAYEFAAQEISNIIEVLKNGKN